MANRKRKPFSQIPLDEANSTASKKSKGVEDSENNNCEARAGTINYMVLKNFMCHSLLEVKFTNNVSIVIGKNGSGKSAILTALIIGLGGKATLTNRGKNIKGFVKAGKPSGSIEIDLSNEGPMAYRPDVYGRHINIVRNLTASGSGGYKIRSETRELISTSAKEIHNITMSLNIQVDNPVCILNQDTSRNFLSSKDPKSKFTLFMKATKLEMLEMEYKKIQSNKNASIAKLEEKEEHFRKLQDDRKKLKSKIESWKSIVSLKDRVKVLQCELKWAKVKDMEKEVEHDKSNVDAIEKKLNDSRANSAKKEERLKAVKETIVHLEQQIEEVKHQIDVQKQPQVEVRSKIEELARKYNTKKMEKTQIQVAIESKRNDIISLEKDIAASNENMSKVEQQKMQRIKELAGLQDKLKGMDDYLETAKNDLFQTRSDLSRREEEEENLRSEIRQIDQKIAEEKTNLEAVKRESGNDLILYGRDVPRVKEMIARCRNRFQQEPRGPLGSYIKLKDKKWAVAIEGYIGPATLSAFTVDNNKDNQLLREIFNKVWTSGSQPQIITSKFIFKKHDVSKNIVHEPAECVSLYNAIEIDDSVVANCIVDNSGPENILLIPNDRKAQELLSSQPTVPKNCHQGVTIKGDLYYPDPNYRTYGSKYRRAKYLQIDTKEYILELQRSIDKWLQKKQTISTQLQSFLADRREQLNKRNQLEEKVKKVNLARAQIRRQLEELNSAAEPEVQNVQYLEQELEEVGKSLNEKLASMNTITDEIREIRKAINEKEVELAQLRNSTQGLNDRIQALKDDVRENQTKQQEIATSDEFDRRRISEFENKFRVATSQKLLKERALEKLLLEASKEGERLPDLRHITHVSNEMKEVKCRIERIEMNTEDQEAIKQKYNELTEKFLGCDELIKYLKCDIDELNRALEQRSNHYKLTENFFIGNMKRYFEQMLKTRQFKGTIDIDMKEKKLELIVIPQHGSQGLTTTSNLSGGERSFSTIAFLYSLWQCMDFPFYFLDEFDVYMDKLNRTKVIDILLHHAHSKPHIQFVFLTPQDVSFINKDVSILRLEDPERFKT